jgi:hypothetical protein
LRTGIAAYTASNQNVDSLLLFLCSCRKLASDNQATVFATDAILTTIMCMRSSRYSWDLLVSKQNGKVGSHGFV